MSLSIFSANAEALWNGKIFAGSIENEISFQELTENLAASDIIVLGEEHDIPAVQAAEAAVIKSVVLQRGEIGNFNLAWEFLNFSAREYIQDQYDKFLRSETSVYDFLHATVGKADSYATVIEALREMNGSINAVNLSRAEKKPIVDGGLSAADPSLIPEGFGYGSDNYFERFKEAMGSHTTPEKLSNYWDAQCLTDDVMAYHVSNISSDKLTFLITGSFHSDFDDGVVVRLRIRSSEKKIVVVRFVNASYYPEEDLWQVIIDENYGLIAPYVYFVNEPFNYSLKQDIQL